MLIEFFLSCVILGYFTDINVWLIPVIALPLTIILSIVLNALLGGVIISVVYVVTKIIDLFSFLKPKEKESYFKAKF